LKIKINLKKYHFSLNIFQNETLSNQLREKGHHGSNVLDIFEKYIKRESHVLDLGANIGYYSILAALVTGPNGKVFAFEPEKNNADLLLKNSKENNLQNIQLCNYVVSDKDGSIDFYINPENFGDHSVAKNTYKRCYNIQNEFRVPIKLNSIKLDNFFSIEEFRKIDLIKMDIQGSESKAIKGMESLLQEHRPVILMEYSPAHIYSAGSSPFEIFAFIENYSYIPYKIIDKGQNPCEVIPYSIMDMLNDTFANKETFQGIDILLVNNNEKI
jgi:FkbM family methyltransferase